MMTLSLAPNPKWYFLDAQGKPAAGGTLTTWRSDDHSTFRFVYSDAAGTLPYTDPILLDATGGTPVPIYWDVTTAGLYFIQVKDAAGNLIFSLDNFPIIGGGGVTPINSSIDIENHLINGAFLFIDAPTTADSILSPIPIGSTRIAPASGFFKNSTGEYVPTLGANLSGWSYLAQGGAGSASSIRFVDVNNIGEGLPTAPSANATRYFRYQLTALGTPQTVQQLFQVIPGVQTFSGQLLTITLDVRANVAAQGAVIISQYFGTGGAPHFTVNTSQNFTFSVGDWSRITLQITVPSVMGFTKGTDENDSVNFVVDFPLNTVGTFEVTNLQLQIGNFGLTPYIYQTYNQDQYKVLIDLMTLGNLIFPTGALRWMSVANPGGTPISIPGWIVIDNVTMHTLGSSTSGAFYAGNIYKNLYIAWWNCFPQTECQVAGGVRGASALVDFNANKAMTPPLHILNTVIAGAGAGLLVNEPFGFFEGERTHTLTIGEMPAHDHQIIDYAGSNGSESGSTRASPLGNTVTGIRGGNQPHNNMQPTFYLWLYVKL